jgi:hypothetical protein
MSYPPRTNYRETYFQHPSLTKITGDPTYTDLSRLEKEIKANGKSVHSTLGGGNQGHLGLLVCSATTYERISPGVPFVRPIVLVLPDLVGATGPQIRDARLLFDDNTKLFTACQLIERTIVQQISTAINSECLTDVTDSIGSLQGTVPEILQSLFDTYGAITPQSLTATKTQVESTTYDHTKPIANLFYAINDYATMAEAADAAETPRQLINIAMIIITRSTVFASDIRKWNDKPDIEKTWPLFQNHYKAAQKAIRKRTKRRRQRPRRPRKLPRRTWKWPRRPWQRPRKQTTPAVLLDPR